MPKSYTVSLSCITDMTARIDIDAESPEEAAKIAVEKSESWEDADWEFPDNRPEPMAGTIEAYHVEDDSDDGDGVDLPQTTADQYQNARANALLLQEAVEAWPQFDADPGADGQEVSGADLVEWFAEWRARAKAAVLPDEAPVLTDTEGTAIMPDGTRLPWDERLRAAGARFEP